jgi:hypothetical protein
MFVPNGIHGIICIDGVTVGPSEAEYHKSMADPEEGLRLGEG